MFHFNFNLEDGTDGATLPLEPAPPRNEGDRSDHTTSTPQQTGVPFSEIDLDSLLEALPTQISYSFISAPSSAGDGHSPELKLARRDLFDARFQLISEGTGDNPESAGQAQAQASVPASGSSSDPSNVASALQFIDAPSDLVPLVYEGGLKTWECSLDLASCLKRDGHAANARGRRVLELGCGTAVPTLCVLQELFSSPPTGDLETHVHLQDYNASVLHLVTAPNVVLAWYTSPAADAYRNSKTLASEDEDMDVDSDSELHITPQLLHAFKTSLRDHKLRLRFFSGSWDAFELERTGGHYDFVLTSETIYCSSSLASLVRILQDACAAEPQAHLHPCICFVAAKTVYFGVGGGVAEFIRCVESTTDERGNRGQVETIWETSTGVSRKVMCVRWT